ncbi:MAG: hypothetical protein ACM31C_22480 [Acidobacteriota bacterium]
MERFPRGSLPPYEFPAVATVAPQAIARAEPDPEPSIESGEPDKPCDLSTTCPSCSTEMQPEHAHYKCPACGYRDSCCF